MQQNISEFRKSKIKFCKPLMTDIRTNNVTLLQRFYRVTEFLVNTRYNTIYFVTNVFIGIKWKFDLTFNS